jgi:hypothetical protein
MNFVDGLPKGHPLIEAERVASEILSKREADCPSHVKQFIDNQLLDGLIQIGANAKFDDSQLVVRQKMRMLLKSRIRKNDKNVS